MTSPGDQIRDPIAGAAGDLFLGVFLVVVFAGVIIVFNS